MSIQEQIQIDLKKAMIQKNESEKSLLRVVIGEFNRVGKTVENPKAVSILKNMLENAKNPNNPNPTEAAILERYIPKQFDTNELALKISEIVDDLEATSLKDMGRIMSELKAKYPGQYDGNVASKLIKEIFSKVL